jgi:hypothetical protein
MDNLTDMAHKDPIKVQVAIVTILDNLMTTARKDPIKVQVAIVIMDLMHH